MGRVIQPEHIHGQASPLHGTGAPVTAFPVTGVLKSGALPGPPAPVMAMA